VFDIFLTDKPVEDLDPGVEAVYGQIRLGDFQESFVADVVLWKPSQYLQHWRSAVRRIVEGEERSALITSFLEPSLSRYLVWWPLYRDGQNVRIQNQLRFFDQLRRPFSLERYWDSVDQRRQISDNGEKISEWIVPVEDMKAYLTHLKTQD